MTLSSPLHADTRDEIVIDVIRTRRVVRSFTGAPVQTDEIRRVIEAGRWASSASNRRLHRFLVVRDLERLRLVKAISPGMLAVPPTLIMICTDLDRARREGVRMEDDVTTWIDVGTAAMSMMIVAHVLGVGTCPVTSFSPSGLAVALDLPPTIRPELLLMLGYPAPDAIVRTGMRGERLNLDDVIDWEHVGGELKD